MTVPFHDGECAVQKRTGEQDKAARNSRLTTRIIPSAAQLFLSQQVYCAIGSLSSLDELWASFLMGGNGFASTNNDGSVLRLKLTSVQKTQALSPPFHVLEVGDHIGVLFIELTTRRRLRVNGQLIKYTSNEVQIAVAEVFPNCPKYIQKREVDDEHTMPANIDFVTGGALNDELEQWIRKADTFFVTSAHPDGPADTSHRGGKPGFIHIENGKLRIPDYPGNSMFATLGNFVVYPRAGLAFPDFENSRLLQISGDVTLDLMSGTDVEQTGGTGRWWDFTPRKWVISPLNQNLKWTLTDTSPFNP